MQNKNFVLIGGSYGIGAALASILQLKGAEVTVMSRTPSQFGKHIRFDVTSDTVNLSDLPQSIHGLVYLPGTINLKPFHRLTDDEMLEDFRINALYAARTIRNLLPLLKNSGDASVVLFSTVAVAQGMPFHSSVAMAKGAVEGLVRSLAAELAPRIRVNALAPSLTDTPLAAKILSSEDKKKASGERHPLKRIGSAGDLANAAMYLLSDDSSWVTGQVIHVDGGLSALRI
ncbi:MAG: SDR family oxidoreductase [Cyclobacteriaceae bacterium]|nr:SDR family oxidoreductase [Cyclobacteriaceae bacterium]MCX7636483.1 SDR family oxidoreductase [Cyclobacteriaceae bacterium]MDW8330516.1 SDR family oxidoreductase [Cyclobacteriaceae bacterium]